MAKVRIEGSFVALITPFNRDGSVDYEGFRTLLEFHESNGTSAVLIMGSTGEVSMLEPEERYQIISETVKYRTGKMLFYYGCTGAHTQATIDYVSHAAREGADGAIIAAPSYICASNEDIVDYFLQVADASDIPVGIYNNPPRVKTDLSAADIVRLSEHPNIVINKESTSRVAQVAQLCAAKPDMSLMCCCSPNLGLVVPTMALGGHGTANMTGNIIPQEMAVISKPWRNENDPFNFREAWLRNLPMLHFAYSATNPVAVKSLMRAIGMPAGDLRRPLQLLEPERLRVGLNIVRDLELDKRYGYSISGLD